MLRVWPLDELDFAPTPGGLDVWPLDEVHVTSPYGMRDIDDDFFDDPTMHHGIDLRARVGTPLYSMGDGFVRALGPGAGGSGGGIALDIVDDDDGRLVFLHLSGIVDGLRAGDRVHAGQLVGFTGNTGASQAPHLHIQWQPDWPAGATADLGPVLARLGPPSGGGGGGGLLLLLLALGGGWALRRKKGKR